MNVKRLTAYFLLVVLLFTGCAQKEAPVKPHVDAYENANALLSEGRYAEAAAVFESLNGYEEAMRLCLYSRAKDQLSKGDYAGAYKGFVALGDFRDSVLASKYAGACLDTMDQDGYVMVEGAEALDEIALYLDSAERAEATRLSLYNRAAGLLEAGKYDSARWDFDALGGYRDSALMAEYVAACKYESGGIDQLYFYLMAVEAFEALGDFKDSAARAQNVLKTVYDEADRQLSEGNPEKAEQIFYMLAEPYESNWTDNKYRPSYLDSENMVTYARIEQTAQNGSPAYIVHAADRFEDMNGFKDTMKRAEELREQVYQLALGCMEREEYAGAEEIFRLQDYKDSRNMAKYADACKTEQAAELNFIPEGYLDAAQKYLELGEFKDSAERALSAREKLYLACVDALEKEEFGYAKYLFSLQDYRDSAKLGVYAGARNDALYAGGDTDVLLSAAAVFEELGGVLDSSGQALTIRDNVYDSAVSALNAGKYDLAEKLFSKQNHKDSAEMVMYTRAARAESRKTAEGYIEAAGMYESMNGFSDSEEKAKDIRESVYESAQTALKENRFSEAQYLFGLQDYMDSGRMVTYTQAAELNFTGTAANRIEAAGMFENMDGFLDSEDRAKEIRESIYDEAHTALNGNDYNKAQFLFGLQDYMDSRQMIRYTQAARLEYEGKKVEAAELLYAMGDFNKSSERADRILDDMLSEAKACEDNHQYDRAHEIYASLGEYRNGAEHSVYVLCEKALYEAGDDYLLKIGAAELFEENPSVFDSAERAESIRSGVYSDACDALENKRYDEAAYLFSLQDYSNGLSLSDYAAALALEFAKDDTCKMKIEAARAFEAIPGVRDSADRANAIRTELARLGHEKLESGCFEEARHLFLLQPEWEKNELYAVYAEARKTEEDGNEDFVSWIKAYEIYTSQLTGQLDADERAEKCMENAYLKAWEFSDGQQFDRSIELFGLLGDYKDSGNAKIYTEAAQTLHNAGDNAKEYVRAKEMYVSLGDYRESEAVSEKIDRQLFVRFVDDIGVFTKEGLARFEKNGKWGYISTEGEVVVNAKYDMAYDFSEGMAAVKLGERWGYIDTKGDVVIDLKFVKARSFSDGMAAVVEDRYWEYIRKDGTVLEIPTNVWSSDAGYVGNFENGFAFIGDYDDYDRYVMNKTGEIVARRKPLSFTEGISPICTDRYGSEYSYITLDGKRLSDIIWSEARPFENGRGIVGKNGRYGIVDTDGSYVSTPMWDEIQPAADGIFLVKRDGNYGYIDMNGYTVSQPQWNYAYPYSDGRALVWQNGYYGYIDKSGETAIDFVYDEAKSFMDGYAFVKQYGAWKCIDTNGETVFEIDERVADVHASAENIRILVSDGNGYYGYIDQSGSVVIDMEWTAASETFREGLAFVRAGSYDDYCCIDENGNVVFGSVGDEASFFENGVAVKMVDGYSDYYYLIDKTGAQITKDSANSITRMDEDRFVLRYYSSCSIVDAQGITICPAFYDNIQTVTDHMDGKTVFVSATAKDSELYKNGRNESEWFPIDRNGRVLPRTGKDETGVFAIRLNGVWYFTNPDGEIIF